MVLISTVVGLVTLIAGCGTGQFGPRYLQNTGAGSEGQVGSIAVRGALFAATSSIEGDAVYRPGDAVTVQATIVNEGARTDRLVSVRSPIAGNALVLGDSSLPAQHTLTAGYTGPAATATLPETTSIELRLTELNTAIRAGLTYPVVFTFAHAGKLRLELRVANPEVPREYCPLPPNGKAPKVLTAPLGRAPKPPVNPPPDCSSLPTSIPEVQLLDIESPLHHPTWATEHNVLFGFVEQDGLRRLVRVDPETGETLRSRALEGSGENFALITRPDERIAVPLTGSDRIALFDPETLTEIDSVGDVPSPSWVTVEETSKSLLALSEDGSTVTGLDYERTEVLFRHEVAAGPQAAVTPGNDVDPSFWLVTPEEVTYLSGTEPQPGGTHRGRFDHTRFGSDDTSAKSAYVAEEGSRVVQLLEGDSRGGLAVVASNELSETVEHVVAEPQQEHRVYAATAHTLVSMRYDTLETITTTDFRSTLEQAGLGHARLSEVTVGDDYVYLAVAGEPYVVKVRKDEALTE